jgi:chemotaxis protein methyltransferase WspC
MHLTPVTDLLSERIGLDPESLGPTVLPRAVASRMRALGLGTSGDYALRLAGDAQEFQALLGDLIVPETWFFRGGEVFAFLARHVAEAVRQQPAGAPFRILSVPCSTGEEPYSLAIALVEAGVPPAAWVIEGVDISSHLVERARAGRFGNFSFRQTAPEIRQRYFRPEEDQWELVPAVRALVRFRQDNLLAPGFLAGERPFHVIFCRNLFIYLDPAGRRRGLDALDRLLVPQGMLCTGHAEPLDFRDPRFQRTGPEGCFLHQRTGERQKDEEIYRAGGKESLLQVEPARAVEIPSDPLPAPIPVSPFAVAAQAPVDLLALARQHADGGHLDKAFAGCQQQLKSVGPSADLYSLMGMLHQARQEKAQAVRCFQRALYLDPQHRAALMHLMLLCQELGDDLQAARLRRRLERAAPGGEE